MAVEDSTNEVDLVVEDEDLAVVEEDLVGRGEFLQEPATHCLR